MTTAELTLTPTNGHSLTHEDLDALTGLSAVSPEAALRRPVSDLVQATLDAAGRSRHTARAYLTAAGQFLAYLDQTAGGLVPAHLAADWRPFAEPATTDSRQTSWTFHPPAAVLRLVSPATLDGFRAALEAGGATANTASQRVYAVKTFLAVAYREGAVTDEQAQRIGLKPYRQRQRRDAKPVGRRLTHDEVRTLRGAVNTASTKGKRDLAILDAMLFLGLRCEETAELALEGFYQDQGRWWVDLTGKGEKTRRLKVSDPLFKSLTAWLRAAGLPELGKGGAGPVFWGVNKGDNLTGCPVNSATVARLVTEYGTAAELAPERGAGRLGPHDLRRTCARNAYDNGASLLLVQAMLGHSDPKTTAHYIGAFDGDGETATDFVRY